MDREMVSTKEAARKAIEGSRRTIGASPLLDRDFKDTVDLAFTTILEKLDHDEMEPIEATSKAGSIMQAVLIKYGEIINQRDGHTPRGFAAA